MKTFLLTALAATMTLTAGASGTKAGIHRTGPVQPAPAGTARTFNEKYGIDRIACSQMSLTEKGNAMRRAAGAADDGGLVIDPQGTTSRYAMAVDIYLSHMGGSHVGGFGADVTISDDGKEFYSRAFTLNFFQQGCATGQIEGDKVVFESGQYIYDTADGEKAYFYAAYLPEGDEWPEFCDSFSLIKDEKGRYMSEPGYYYMVMTEEEAEYGINEASDIICFGFNYVFNPLPADLTENRIPDDAEVYECQMAANSLSDQGGMVMMDITVGTSGDDIYICGLSDYLKTACLKGTKTSDDTYTFDTHQYIGYYNEGEYPYIYEFAMVNPLYFDGESIYFQEVESVDMTFNEDHTMLTLEEDAGLFISSYGDIKNWNEAYWNMMAGDFNQPLTPSNPTGVECYAGYEAPYVIFEWSNISTEGIPMVADKLWCQVIINGEPFEFLPEYYEGLKAATDRVYYNAAGIDWLYPGDFTTLYLYGLDGVSKIRTIGVRIGYDNEDGVSYSETVLDPKFQDFEDKAFVPSAPSHLVYYNDYYNNFRFDFDGKDEDGNLIPENLLAAEILLDGEPLMFSDSDYWFHDGNSPDTSIIGLSENSINFSYSLVNKVEGGYILELWGHEELPEFKTAAVRIVCTGGDALTYGEPCEIALERPATPANPWDVTFDEDMKQLNFGALPIDADGNGLAPWSYGYEVYVNGELYVFQAEAYDLESDITLIPYNGFEYNYDFYLGTDYVYNEETWDLIDQKMVMEVSMGNQNPDISKIGVRAVYTDGEGNTTYSDIVNSDGTVETGVKSIGNADADGKWYNLQGIEVAAPEAGSTGVYIHRGRKVSVK